MYDSQSLTKAIYEVTKKGKAPVPITEIASKVNQIWRPIKQGCKNDVLEVGDNWKDFYWPTERLSLLPCDEEKSIQSPPTPTTLRRPDNENEMMTMMRSMKTGIGSIDSKVEGMQADIASLTKVVDDHSVKLKCQSDDRKIQFETKEEVEPKCDPFSSCQTIWSSTWRGLLNCLPICRSCQRDSSGQTKLNNMEENISVSSF